MQNKEKALKNTKIPLVNLKKQYLSIKKEMDGAIHRILDTTAFIMGKEVLSFEKNFAKFSQAKYAVGTSSGTSALQLALVGLGIGKGDEVITTPFTFIATTESIIEVGARPVLVDIERDTYNIDPKKIEKAITKQTKAIVPVHLYGHPVDLDPIKKIAKKYNLKVIEDACQAHGAIYKGHKVGAICDAGCFSFYPGKNLGCCGDGGMLVTNDKKLYEKARLLRDHGRSDKYTHIAHGFNFRLDAIQAAVLNAKLKYLSKWNSKRGKNAKIYNRELRGIDQVIRPAEKDYAKHVYHLYVIRVKGRDKLKDFLAKNGVSSGVHYPIPLHKQPIYKKMRIKHGNLSVANESAEDIISLPMFAELKEKEIIRITNLIKQFLGTK